MLFQWDSDLEESDDEDNDYVLQKPAPKPKAQPKKILVAPKPPVTKPAASVDDAVDALEKLSVKESTSAPAKSAAPEKKVAVQKVVPKKAAPKKKTYDSSDEDSDDFTVNDDSDLEIAAAPPARGRSARAAAKAKTYVLDDSSDEDFDEDSDCEFDQTLC